MDKTVFYNKIVSFFLLEIQTFVRNLQIRIKENRKIKTHKIS